MSACIRAGMMIRYTDVLGLRDEALSRTSDLPVQPHPYEIAGGQESANPWNAVGFFLTDGADLKLVFELLYFLKRRSCALRVYKEAESGAEPTFALKALLENYNRELAMSAADEFVSMARKIEALPYDEGVRASLPEELRGFWDLASFPVPPPIALDEL